MRLSSFPVLLFLILPQIGYCYYGLVASEMRSSWQQLVEKIISVYFRNEDCIVYLQDSHLKLKEQNLFRINNELKIPIVLINVNERDEESIDILLKLIVGGCRTFIVNTRNSKMVSNFIYNACAYARTTKPIYSLFLQEKHKSKFLQYLDDHFLRIAPNTILGLSVYGTKKKEIYLYTYTIGDNLRKGTMFLTDIWDGKDFKRNVTLYVDKLKNLGGTSVTLSMLDYEPYCFVVSDEYYEGMEVRAVQEISYKFNFTLNVDVSQDGFGDIFDNGTGTGVMGAVFSGKSQMGVGGFYLIKTFADIYEITEPYLQAGVTFLTPKPTRMSFLWYICLPFQNLLWIVIVVFFFVVTCLLHAIALLEYKLLSGRRKTPFTSFGYALLKGINILVAMSIERTVHSVVQHLITWLFVVSMLITTAYNSDLVSFLTVPLYQKPIETVIDLVKSQYECGITDAAWNFVFEGVEDPDVQNVASKLKLFSNLDEVNTLAKQGKLAILVERLTSGSFSNGNYLDDDVLNALYIMKEDVLDFHVGIILETMSPFVDKFNIILRWLRDTGIIKYWELEINYLFRPKKLEFALTYIASSYADASTSLDMEHLGGAFVVLLIGLGVSYFVYCQEVCVWYISLIDLKRIKRRMCLCFQTSWNNLLMLRQVNDNDYPQ